MSSPRRADLPLLDPLRLLASSAVVYQHMRGEFLFGVAFGLPLFLVIMFGLTAGSNRSQGPLGHFSKRKAKYLLAPWLRWSLFYLVAFGLVDLARGIAPWQRLRPEMLTYGGHVALWFLPFATLAVVLVKVLLWATQRLSQSHTWMRTWPVRGPVPTGLAWAICASLSTLALTPLAQQALPDLPGFPVAAVLRVLPAILWGLAIGQSRRTTSDKERSLLLAAVASLALVSLALSPFGAAYENLPRRFALAVSLACIGFGVRLPVPASVRWLSGTTFGIYLVHPFIGRFLQFLFDASAWPAAWHAVCAWSLSCCAVIALRQTKLPWHELNPRQVSARKQTAPILQDSHSSQVSEAA